MEENMLIAEIADGRINVDCPIHMKEMVKEIPGAGWDSKAKTWHVPLSWAACVQLRAIFGADLQIGDDLNNWAGEEITGRVEPCMALRTAEDAERLAFLTQLRPFQRAGVEFMVTAKAALNADEMRLGKTVQTIATLEVLGDGAYPALIVCPNTMKLPWQDEFKQWAPKRRVVVVTGTPTKRKAAIAAVRDGEADVATINYEALTEYTRISGYGSIALSEKEKTEKELNEIAWKTVVADEAHKAMDPKTKQTRALWYLGRGATYRYTLTGTPGDDLDKLWALMRFVSPLEFPEKIDFCNRYALQSWNFFGGMDIVGIKPETRDELFRFLDPRMIRRTRAAVLPQLPAKIPVTRKVEMGGTLTKQGKAYEQLRSTMMAELDNGTLLATSPLVKLTRLRQFASACGEFGEPAFDVVEQTPAGLMRMAGPFSHREQAEEMRDGQQFVRDITPLILTEPSCKVDALEELASELAGAKAVVFAESEQLIGLAHARLEKRGYKASMVTGRVSELDRQVNIKAFQEGPTQFILVTLGAGGAGLTLSAASIVIFLQRSFSLIDNTQAEDRIIDMNMQDSPVVIDIVTTDTIEARVHEVQGEKAARLEEYARDAETLKVWLAGPAKATRKKKAEVAQ
jgi:SNF2 family DNA or RNA helicase